MEELMGTHQRPHATHLGEPRLWAVLRAPARWPPASHQSRHCV